MSFTLYYSRNPNPRLAVASARFLKAPVEYVWASPFDPSQSDRFRKLNPMLRIPILVEGSDSLWEADAIVCKLAIHAGSDFWRTGALMPEMIRWISWGKANFVQACDMVHFEYGTKQRYHLGPVDPTKAAEGLAMFGESAALLNTHLQSRPYLVDDRPSYADFRMATFLPFNDVACLPLSNYPHLNAWYERLTQIPEWADPFNGLSAPLLPMVAPRPV